MTQQVTQPQTPAKARRYTRPYALLLHITDEDHQALSKLAKADDRSMKNFAQIALSKALKQALAEMNPA